MIDSHFHVWQLDRGDYGWLTPALQPIYRDVTPADWQRQAAPCGITRGIVVQAAPTEAETQFLLAQAAAHPALIAGIVGWVDMTAADAPHRIASLAADPKLVGLRPMLHDLPDPAWILRDALRPSLAAMQAADLTFDALIRPVHLPHVLTLAQRHPQLRIVIDHGAKPAIADDAFAPWADGMTRLANNTHAFCKLSGLLTEAGGDATADRLRPYVAHLLACFGTDRLLWGSDWPVLELAASYAAWHAMATSLVPADMREAIFTRTAEAAYPRLRLR